MVERSTSDFETRLIERAIKFDGNELTESA